MTEIIGSGSEYQVTIPEYADDADIQAAIKLLMYGTTTPITQNSQISNFSIAGYIKTLDSRIDGLASTEVVQLNVEDLNTITTTGKFVQTSNSNAEAASNYPLFLTKKWAGSLTVNTYDENVFQFYEGQAGTSGAVTSQGFIAWRSKPVGAAWHPWIIASDTSHLHDERYYTETEIDTKLFAFSNINNTSDANKPVSTAQQTALDLKLDKTGGTLSGPLTLPNSSPTNNLHATTKVYVDTGLANKPTSQADNIFVQQTQPSGAVAGDLWFW